MDSEFDTVKSESDSRLNPFKLGLTIFIISLIIIGFFAIMYYFADVDKDKVVQNNIKVQAGTGLTINEDNSSELSLLSSDDDVYTFEITLNSEGRSDIYLGGASYAEAEKVEFFNNDSKLLFVWIPDEKNSSLSEGIDKSILSVGNIPHLTLADNEYTSGNVKCPAMINSGIPILSFEDTGCEKVKVVITSNEPCSEDSFLFRFVSIYKDECPYVLVGPEKIGNSAENEKVVYFNQSKKAICFYNKNDYNRANAETATGIVYSLNGTVWNTYGENNPICEGEIYVRIAETESFKQSNIVKITIG